MASTTPQRLEIELRELGGARPGDIELLRRFYTACYEPAFPNPDERESLANMESYLDAKEQGWYGPNNYHVIVALRGDDILGGTVCDYLAEPNAAMIEYLLVQPDFRASGLGVSLAAEIERLCRADAAEIDGRELDWLVGETEDPYRAATTEDFDTFVRARIMARANVRIVDFHYVQPALSEAGASVENLLLIARPGNGKAEVIRTEVVLSIVAEYFRWAMRIEDPTSNSEYLRMASALDGRRSIELVEIGDYLGWDRNRELRITDVPDTQHPELAAAIAVYESAYTDPETTWPGDIFRSAVERKPTLAGSGYTYHLWAIHSTAAGSCDGMASFVTMPTAGYGGYLTFDHPLRGSGRLRQIIARIEEQMIRDNPDASGWYIECNEEVNCEIFARAGFFELDLVYEQPLTQGSGSQTPPLRLHLLYKSFGRVYRPPIISRAAFLRAVAEIYWMIYTVDAQTDASFRLLADSLEACETVSAVRVGSVVEINTGDDLAIVAVDTLLDQSHTEGPRFAGSIIDSGPGGEGQPAGRASGPMEQIVRVIRRSGIS